MTENNKYLIELDDLAVGLTRPPMLLGVKLQLAVANLIACVLSYIYIQTIYTIPIFIVFHFIAVRLSVKEPRFIDLFVKKMIKTPPVFNVIFWGKCNSYAPN